jgi:hypothetical protein
MNYEKRFCEIRDFLNTHEYLHELELLNRFESKILEPYDSWFDQIRQLTDDQLIEFECNQNTEHISDKNLVSFMNKVKELTTIPVIKVEETQLDQVYKRKMNNKKVHEIQTLKTFIDSNVKINSFIDVGSGAGHLSQALITNSNKISLCIDMNAVFQKIGLDKIKRWLPQLSDKITFKQLEIQSDSKNQFDKKSMLLGLHSCGPLSTHLVQACQKNFLNFGCCYHKLKDEYNISKLAKENPISFTNHALTMAAKGNRDLSITELNKKFIVKKYRYALHFLCIEVLKIPFQSMGNAKRSDYLGSFAEYAQKYLSQANRLSHEDLDSFYNKNINKIDKIIRAGSLRAQLSRLIEIYIILDRVIYSREQGINSNMFELFDVNISPRNIAIYSDGDIIS